MTLKQKIINRLNKGFGFSLTDTCAWLTRQRNGYGYGASWQIHKFTCEEPAGEAVKWDRWVLADGEIIEYVPSQHEDYVARGWLIENK